MRVGSVEIPDGAAARLACLLHESGEHSLAIHIGHAVDHLHERVALTGRDRRALLRVLVNASPELAELRAVLLADEIGDVHPA